MSRPSPLASARPLFLLGAPRSGTTFATKLLDSHPEVLITNEVRVFTFFEHAFREIPTGDRGGLHCARSNGQELVAALRSFVPQIVERCFENIAEARGDKSLKYWGDKNPHHSSVHGLIHESFPDALYVRMKRDPRDIVCSIAEMHGTMKPDLSTGSQPRGFARLLSRQRSKPSMSVEDGASLQRSSEAVGVSIETSATFLESLPSEQWIEVCYEELVTDPSPSLQRIFRDFLGLEDLAPVEAWLRDHGQKDSHGRFKENADFASRSIGRWRDDLTKPQQKLVENALGPSLRRDAYPS